MMANGICIWLDQIDDSNFDLAYGEILRVLGAGLIYGLILPGKVTGVEDQ